MARKDALLRLHERLVAKRNAIQHKLADELKIELPVAPGGDVADSAMDGASSELNSRLAALESRELWQIERAIEMIRQGRYGLCESCEQAIPIERLKALPFAPYCVECQRKQEELGISPDDDLADWESAFEVESRMNDRELTLGDIDLGAE